MFQKIGPWEIVLIVGAVLLVFGPSKLPQLGKSIGETFKEFRKSMKQVSDEVTAESSDPETPTTKDAEKKA